MVYNTCVHCLTTWACGKGQLVSDVLNCFYRCAEAVIIAYSCVKDLATLEGEQYTTQSRQTLMLMYRLENLTLSCCQPPKTDYGRKLLTHGNVMNQLTDLRIHVADRMFDIGAEKRKSPYSNPWHIFTVSFRLGLIAIFAHPDLLICTILSSMQDGESQKEKKQKVSEPLLALITGLCYGLRPQKPMGMTNGVKAQLSSVQKPKHIQFSQLGLWLITLLHNFICLSQTHSLPNTDYPALAYKPSRESNDYHS